ncbi:hypothetical protein BRADI_3g54935v3 [Brachypodium distachyon]|uniref:Uncharacterized protein n=1 Tax=Brachypodium distachyon TaxID=15368 RepID=A0A0Q3FQ52_BRADI|nr:hypothetical protein BRADI_3g54935v3 [Brachypodium distachyon]
MARGARCPGRWSASALLLFLIAIALLVAVPLLAPPGERTAVASSAGGRRALLPAARSRRFRPRRWNSAAGLEDGKHEVPSGPNPDSNR